MTRYTIRDGGTKRSTTDARVAADASRRGARVTATTTAE